MSMRRFTSSPAGSRAILGQGLAFVCRDCRAQGLSQQQRRRIASSSTRSASASAAASAPRPVPGPPAAGFTSLPSRRLISVAGPDAAKYLQGVITSSIATGDARPRRQGFYTAFLNAQGRVLYDVFVYPDTIIRGDGSTEPGQNFLIEVDANEAARLQAHIKRYKLRAKFDVRLLPADEATVWHAWNDGADPALEEGLVPSSKPTILLRDPRAPRLGHRLIRPGTTAPPLSLDQTDEMAYRIRRYLSGVPEGQDEIIREHALPLESNMDVMTAIDFHKGCYVGQELTIRTRHRGVVRKRILPCVVYPPGKPVPSSLQYRPSGDDGAATSDEQAVNDPPVRAETIPKDTSIGRPGRKGRSAGRWLAGVGNLGLALCRLEVMTDVVMPGEAAAAGFDAAQDEFVVEWGAEEAGGRAGTAKVKAFVPAWLREGIEGGA